jgi:uncharacterized membrane protein (DUF485 family)
MTHPQGAGAPARAGGSAEHPEIRAAGSAEHPEIDWLAAERSPEFRELVGRRRAFVVPATIFFLAWYFGFIILAGYAPDFMGETFLVDGLTVGYVLALTQFIMTWGLAAWYLRKSDRVFDPLARRAAARAVEAGRGEEAGRRFERPAAETQATGDEEVTRP